MKKRIRRIIRFLKSRFEFVSMEDRRKVKEYERDYPDVHSTKDTLELIYEKNLSIARYGDGEFDICNQDNKEDKFQRPNDELSRRLREILAVEEDGFLVCIPPFNSEYNNIKNYYGPFSFWQNYWLNKFTKIKPLLAKKEYGNSFVSRDTVFYENELYDITKLWDKRKVVFVYGKGGRFEEDSILFTNAEVIDRVLIPPQNAFDNYEEILECCRKYTRDVLFLISAGPTATVLAYDLFKEGYRALDIGHMPACYRQYKGEIVSPEALPVVKGN